MDLQNVTYLLIFKLALGMARPAKSKASTTQLLILVWQHFQSADLMTNLLSDLHWLLCATGIVGLRGHSEVLARAPNSFGGPYRLFVSSHNGLRQSGNQQPAGGVQRRNIEAPQCFLLDAI